MAPRMADGSTVHAEFVQKVCGSDGEVDCLYNRGRSMKKTIILLLISIGSIVGCLPAVPVNTATLQPTLMPQERENYVRESFSSSSNCKLPCWWGITPGETTWKDTEELLHYLGVRIGAAPGYGSNTVFHGTG